MDLLDALRNLDTTVVNTVILCVSNFFTAVVSILLTYILTKHRGEGNQANGDERRKNRCEQIKPCKLTRADKPSIAHVECGLPFLKTDSHPRRFLCPDCLKNGFKTYLTHRHISMNFGEPSDQLCKLCGYKRNLMSAGLSYVSLQNEANDKTNEWKD